MKCPTCEKEDLKSRVYDPGYTITTAMRCLSYWDEDGKQHRHDSNAVTSKFTCSNGHEWSEEKYHPCWCGWPNKKGEI